MKKRSEIAGKKSSRPETVTCPVCNVKQEPADACARCGEDLKAGGEAAAKVDAAQVEGEAAVEEKRPAPLSEPPLMENISKLSMDLESKLGQKVRMLTVSALPADDRRALATWLTGAGHAPLDVLGRMGLTAPKVVAPAPARDWALVTDPPGGDVVTYVHGQATYPIVRFGVVTVGPYTITRTLRPGQSPSHALAEMSAHCEAMAALELEQRRDKFIEAMVKIKKAVKAVQDDDE